VYITDIFIYTYAYTYVYSSYIYIYIYIYTYIYIYSWDEESCVWCKSDRCGRNIYDYDGNQQSNGAACFKNDNECAISNNVNGTSNALCQLTVYMHIYMNIYIYIDILMTMYKCKYICEYL
jgi:hypothetical protein